MSSIGDMIRKASNFENRMGRIIYNDERDQIKYAKKF